MVQTNNQAANSVGPSLKDAISTDPLKHFFIERYKQSYINDIDTFLRVLSGRETDYRALNLSMAALKSARDGRPVRLQLRGRSRA